MSYKIKKLEKSDLKEHLGSLIATYENLSAIWDMELVHAEKVFGEMQKQWSYIFVALNPENWIIGCGSLLIEQKIQKHGSSCGHIEDIVVRKWFEWQGIGSKIIKSIMAELENHNCYKVILDCEEGLADYYTRFGFEVDGVFMRKYLK